MHRQTHRSETTVSRCCRSHTVVAFYIRTIYLIIVVVHIKLPLTVYLFRHSWPGLSQAERQFKRCVNGDTSFLWESERPRLTFSISALEFRDFRPKSIFTQNGSNDVYSRKDAPFAVKSVLFIPLDLQAP